MNTVYSQLPQYLTSFLPESFVECLLCFAQCPGFWVNRRNPDKVLSSWSLHPTGGRQLSTDGKHVLTMVLCPIEPSKTEKGRGSKETGRKAAISYRTVRGTHIERPQR